MFVRMTTRETTSEVLRRAALVRWYLGVSRRAKILVKLLFSATLLALVVSRVDSQVLLRTLRGADPLLVLLWYSSVPIANLLAAWRWKILAPRLSFSTAHKYTWIGVFYGQILPGSIAGDVAKGVS